MEFTTTKCCLNWLTHVLHLYFGMFSDTHMLVIQLNIWPCFLQTFVFSFQYRMHVLSPHCVWLFATPWTVGCQTPLSIWILQARTLQWIAKPSSRGSSQPRDWTQVSCIAGGFLTVWATREAHYSMMKISKLSSQKKIWGKLKYVLLSAISQHEMVTNGMISTMLHFEKGQWKR